MLFSINIKSQISDGEYAPDFTTTDINGVEHNLYDLLSEGKSVVLDFFTTWCDPCWDLHESHVLTDLFEHYGPNGSNDFFVLGIESDENTNIECLNDLPDCDYRTVGDWTEGVNYPMINDHNIKSAYGVYYYPTVFIVTPDRKVFELKEYNYNALQNLLAWQGHEAKLEEGLRPKLIENDNLNQVFCHHQFRSNLRFPLYNGGTETIYSADVILKVNDEIYEESHWNGQANPWESIGVFEYELLSIIENKNIEFSFKNINGKPDEVLSIESDIIIKTGQTLNIKVKSDLNTLKDQTSIRISDPHGTFIFYEELDQVNKEYNFSLDFNEVGCYEFSIFDGGGDGILTEIEVSDNFGNIIYNNSKFNYQGEVQFNPSLITSIIEPLEVTVSIVPNPTSHFLTIQTTDEKLKTGNVKIRALDGKLILEQNMMHDFIDVSYLNPGLYIVEISSNSQRFVQRFLKL